MAQAASCSIGPATGSHIAIFAGYRWDTYGLEDRVHAAPISPQGRVGAYSEVATIPPVPHPKGRAAVVSIHNKVWVVGGNANGSATLSVDILDLTSLTWAAGPDLMEARYSHTATPLGGALVVVGGEGPHGRLASTETLGDGATVWSPAPALPQGVKWHAACQWGDRIWISGGWTGIGHPGTPTSAVKSWARNERSWRQERALLAPRYGHCITAMQQRLLVCAGMDSRGKETLSVEELDSTTGSWTHLTQQMPEGKLQPAAVTRGEDLYIVGGCSHSTLHYGSTWRTEDHDLPWMMLDTQACVVSLPHIP